jgi:hypothetical protein
VVQVARNGSSGHDGTVREAAFGDRAGHRTQPTPRKWHKTELLHQHQAPRRHGFSAGRLPRRRASIVTWHRTGLVPAQDVAQDVESRKPLYSLYIFFLAQEAQEKRKKRYKLNGVCINATDERNRVIIKGQWKSSCATLATCARRHKPSCLSICV